MGLERKRLSLRAWVVLVAGYLILVALILVLAWKTTRAGYRLSYVTGDVLALTGQSLYVGPVSQLGLVAWAVAGGMGLFSGLILRKRGDSGRFSGYLLACSALTGYLLLDDLFMIHERMFPHHLHISEQTALLIYAVLVPPILIRYRREILASDIALGAAAAGLFGGSMFIDVLVGHEDYHNFIEDIFKFLGIITWGLYLGWTGMTRILHSRIEATPAPEMPEVATSMFAGTA
jgi:hypothetical protein